VGALTRDAARAYCQYWKSLALALIECGKDHRCPRLYCYNADARHRGPLRPRRKRSGRRAAQNTKKFAPPHGHHF
jgi:hypothetical protein